MWTPPGWPASRPLGLRDFQKASHPLLKTFQKKDSASSPASLIQLLWKKILKTEMAFHVGQVTSVEMQRLLARDDLLNSGSLLSTDRRREETKTTRRSLLKRERAGSHPDARKRVRGLRVRALGFHAVSPGVRRAPGLGRAAVNEAPESFASAPGVSSVLHPAF